MSKTLSLPRKPAPAAAKPPAAAPVRRAGGPRPSAPARPAPPPAKQRQEHPQHPVRGAEARGPAPAAPRPQAGPADTVRLNKRMADLGLCSRREADEWIERGWVRVDGELATMGLQVGAQARITVDRQAQGQQAQQVTILINKPVGYVSGQAEDGHQPAASLVQARNHWRGDPSPTRFSPAQLRGLAPAGRLDIDSVGLLVLTQDGRVARQLIAEDSLVDKEYLVRVSYATPAGEVTTDVQAAFPPGQLARLRHGLSLDGKPLKPARVDWQNPEQLRFVLTEGKKRQIRRMCELVGLKVVGLKRIRIGGVTLGQLPLGQWRYLGPQERF
ncbi:pseudouridine synthase [Ramlibacter sp. 2FC]|uniref:pseudouridine synthase n=1 Tax=Ramlibacter sp. 2FC TaxID=2502188 RepID=UPI00201D448C|nr:pseudouridine synthase [Ramlibacter sp. 2FC]